MKILLDENLPHDLRHHVRGHDVFTVAFMGWAGMSNGRLMSAAAQAGFEAMLTRDAGIAYQHHPDRYPLAVVVLVAPSNDMDDLLPLVPQLLDTLSRLAPRGVAHVPHPSAPPAPPG